MTYSGRVSSAVKVVQLGLEQALSVGRELTEDCVGLLVADGAAVLTARCVGAHEGRQRDGEYVLGGFLGSRGRKKADCLLLVSQASHGVGEMAEVAAWLEVCVGLEPSCQGGVHGGVGLEPLVEESAAVLMSAGQQAGEEGHEGGEGGAGCRSGECGDDELSGHAGGRYWRRVGGR